MPNLTNQAIIDVKVGKILRKYTNDKVVLVGNYLYKDSPFVENVDIAINPEEGGAPIIIKIPYVGYNLELFLGNFNGDEKDEIMVRGEYGGLGGYAIVAIYEYKGGKLIDLDGDDILELVGAYYWQGEYYNTYWYYLADAQIKTGNIKEACQSIDRTLAAQYPYPSSEELILLKKQMCEYRLFSNQYGIDFSSIEYIPSETEKDIHHLFNLKISGTKLEGVGIIADYITKNFGIELGNIKY